MLALDAQDQYNLTIIEPTFSIDPWYANNPNDANLQYETFMTKELEPWVKANLSTTGTEQNWLIGFSKSGIGAQDLILKHPDLFQLAASWDFPADMSAYDEYGSSSANNYGTDANFQANYRLTTAFLDAHKSPFLTNNRIWIGGYYAFQTDVSDYDALLTSEGILHTLGPPQPIAHDWDSGWVPAGVGRSVPGQHPTALTLLRLEAIGLIRAERECSRARQADEVLLDSGAAVGGSRTRFRSGRHRNSSKVDSEFTNGSHDDLVPSAA